MASEEKTSTSLPEFKVREKTVEEVCRQAFEEDSGGGGAAKKTKISGEAVRLTKEATKVYVAELMIRAADRAKLEGAERVTQEHLEKVLPQFLLDFN